MNSRRNIFGEDPLQDIIDWFDDRDPSLSMGLDQFDEEIY